MAMAGMGIGLGSVWRFPFLVGEHGGGAFVLAYFIVIVAIVAPLAIVEIGMGKGIGKGIIDTYVTVFKNRPAGVVVGASSALLYLGVNFFYLSIVGISAYFFYACAVSLWTSMPPDQIYDHVMANKALTVGLFLLICGYVSYVVWRGIGAGIERISKWMVPSIFFCFAVVIVYGLIELPNIAEGYNFFLNPDFAQLSNPKVWMIAVGQGLFAVGVGPGCALVYGSHLSKKSDVSLNALNLVLLVLSAGVIAGMAIIPACIALGLDPASGHRLIFVVIPTLLSRIPFGNILGMFIFAAIFFAAITSAFAQLEVPVTTFMDGFGMSRGKTVLLMTGITIVCAVPAVYNEEVRVFWEELCGNYGYLITAGIGAVAYCWIFGVKRVRDEFINPTSDVVVGNRFVFWTKFIAAPLMILVLINAIFSIF